MVLCSPGEVLQEEAQGEPRNQDRTEERTTKSKTKERKPQWPKIRLRTTNRRTCALPIASIDTVWTTGPIATRLRNGRMATRYGNASRDWKMPRIFGIVCRPISWKVCIGHSSEKERCRSR